MERDSKHMLGVATNLVAAAVVVETKSIVCWYWYFQQLQVAYLKYYESKVDDDGVSTSIISEN
jgi:hypothetical protein